MNKQTDDGVLNLPKGFDIDRYDSNTPPANVEEIVMGVVLGCQLHPSIEYRDKRVSEATQALNKLIGAARLEELQQFYELYAFALNQGDYPGMKIYVEERLAQLKAKNVK
ncbi:MAG: hypothetical protein EPO02_13460 [Nitrospirae bacterium]|nr:MAG: hypothetical protein EPO02_13460 [Nitrospirota bacterium]